MLNIELIGWTINKTRLNADCLLKGENRLSIRLSFSTIIPEVNERALGSVAAKLKVDADDDNEFFFANLQFDFAFVDLDGKNVPEDKKNEILKDEAFPIVYSQLCEYVKSFFSIARLKELKMPLYEEVARCL